MNAARLLIVVINENKNLVFTVGMEEIPLTLLNGNNLLHIYKNVFENIKTDQASIFSKK